MTRTGTIRTLAMLSTFALSACVGGELTGLDDDGTDRVENEIKLIPQMPRRHLCDAPTQEGYASCHAQIQTDAAGVVQPNTVPQGLSPADLQSAYKINTAGGAGATIAIVDAQDNPS